jgi:PKD repeat protein
VKNRAILPIRNVRRSDGRVDSFAAIRSFTWIALLATTLAGQVRADPPLPSIPAANFVVTDFGAIGDGLTNNATAIQNTINAAEDAGGGTVEIPANGTLSTYLCGPINLDNNINLQIDRNAMLQMLPRNTVTNGSVIIPNWPNASTPFINGSGLSDVEISGPGTIDGQGTNWWFPKATTRPNFIIFAGCTRVLIQDVTLQNPPTFHMMLKNSNQDLTIQNIVINTPATSPNTDGMDLASTNVLIRNCYISDGDDNIEIGGSSAPAADITISNCFFGTGHGVSIGSLTQGGVNNVTVSNCSWYGTEYGIKMKTDRDRGGLMQNLKYCDLVMTNVNIPLAFYEYYNSMGSPTKNITNAPAGVAADVAQPITSTTPIFRNDTISNLPAVGNAGIQGPGNIAGIIFGVPEMPITNVTLCNVNIQGRARDGTICLYNIRDIRIIDSNLTVPLTGTNTLTIYNAQFVITNSSPNANTITITGLGSPSNSVLSLFNGQAETGLPVFGANPTLTLGSSTLTISNGLKTGSASVLNFALGTNSTEIIVVGDLSLNGTVNISDGGGFGERTFTLFQYSGNLTTNGTPGVWNLGTVPNTNLPYQVDISSNGFVNLTVQSITLALFTASPTNGFAPMAVTFTDTSMGPITNRFWNFGDTITTNLTVLTLNHTYSSAGTYTVELIASGTDRVSSNVQTGLITVYPPCSLSATNASFTDVGGSDTVTVTPSTDAADWAAVSNDSWIQIAGGSVQTNGTAPVAYTVTTNAASSTRTGTMTIAGQTFTVIQSGDTTPPSVALTPLSGFVSNTITLVADPTDDVAVVNVQFYRDGSVLLGTRSSPPYSLNLNTTTLGDGSHCFTARAFDLAGNAGDSGADCVSVDNNPPSIPTGLTANGVSTTQIRLNWIASVDPGSGVAFYTVYRDGAQIGTPSATTFSDTGLSLGTEYCYTVSAHDNVGRVSQPSAPACGQLTTVATLGGQYNGLVGPTNAPTFAASGPIKLTVGNDGAVAARLRLGRAHVAFKGQFDNSGNATVAITQGPLAPLQVTLHLDLAGADQITGTVAGGSFASQLLASRAAYDRATPCPVSGTYTTIFEPANEEDTTLPQGFGYGTLTVTTTGIGSMSGFLGDGKSLHASAPLSKQNTWPLYVSLYGNQGAALGWVTIGTNGVVGASVAWFRPAKSASPAYPAGFTTNVILNGNVYTQTVKSVSSFAGNGQLTLGGGNLRSNIVEDAYIPPAGDVIFALYNAEHLRMKIDPRTGEFKGRFKRPDQNKTVDFKGLVLQIDQYGAGYFMGANGTGFVIIQLVP